MVTVTIVVFDKALAASFIGINDLLYFAGNSYQRHSGQSEPGFQVRLASWDGGPVNVMNGLTITPHCSLQDLDRSDVYLVPTITGDIEATLEQNAHVIQALKDAAEQGSMIGGNSAGSFFLAEAGLLDGRKATTQRRLADLFRKRYPLVDLRPEQFLTHDGNILCDAGGSSWFDLGLYLIELFCDHPTAMATAKYFMVDLERSAQLSFSPLVSKKHHGDPIVLNIQNWMETHFREPLTMEQAGEQFGLSSRSLIRRFKLATGGTPLNYLQEVRLDAASRLLIQSKQTVEEITTLVGYSDISSFTRLFKRRTGFPPSHYRTRFKSVGSEH